MRKVLLLAALCMALALVFAQVAVAQTRGPSGADGTFNCEDFDFQEDAQAFYEQDTSDPDGLDGPIGTGFTGEEGVACEELPSNGGEETMMMEETTMMEPTTVEPTSVEPTTASPTASLTASPTASPTASAAPLPATGGPAPVLALGAMALLVGSGIMAFGLIRRS